MVQTMDRSMGFAARRLDLIAGNLANLDTPGFRTRDFDFHSAMKEAMAGVSGQNLPLARTHAGHLGPSQGQGVPAAQEVTTGQERNDGNNVSLDRETMLLSRTQSNYVLASTFLQGEVRRTLTAIRDAKQ